MAKSRSKRRTTQRGTAKVTIPAPMRHQIPVLLHPSRFKILGMGRRWGKTATGLIAAVDGHGPSRGHFRGATQGGTIWWVSSSYTTFLNSAIWPQLKRSLGRVGHVSEVDREIRLPNGGSVSVRSAVDPDSLVGAGLDGVVIDEAARMRESVWTESLRPALGDRQGWALFLSTFNGLNWYYKLHQQALAWPEWSVWQRPSSDNPLMAPQELEQIKREIGPRKYAQEHDAVPMAVEGAMWPAEYFADDRIYSDRWPDRFEASAIAVDPSLGPTEMRSSLGTRSDSRSKSDFSAIVFVGLAGGKYWIDSDIERRSPGDIVTDTYEMWMRYRADRVGVEANAFQSVLQDLFDLRADRDRLPPLPLYMIHNSDSKQVRIAKLDPHLANGNLRIRRTASNEELVEQLVMFPIKQFHDDGPDALQMAIELAEESSILV